MSRSTGGKLTMGPSSSTTSFTGSGSGASGISSSGTGCSTPRHRVRQAPRLLELHAAGRVGLSVGIGDEIMVYVVKR